MQARGWEEVTVESGEWDFIYADVGWIHEFITYTVRDMRAACVLAVCACALMRVRFCHGVTARRRRCD